VGAVISYRLRADLRQHWRHVLELSVLVAVLGGIVMATAAGARRTISAYDRLVGAVDPPELLVSPSLSSGEDPTPFYAAVGRLPEVRGVMPVANLAVAAQAGTSSERLADALSVTGVFAPVEGGWDAGFGPPKLIAGRMPNPADPTEVVLSERFAAANDLGVGDHIDAILRSARLAGEPAAAVPPGVPIRLVVVGVGVRYDEVIPFADLNEPGTILGTAALAARVERPRWEYEAALVDVEPGADLDAVTEAIEAVGGRDELGTGGGVRVSNQASSVRGVSDAIQPLGAALALSAVGLGLVVLVVAGQAVARASREVPEDVWALRALGSRRADRVMFLASRAAAVGAAAAAGAVVVAVALSGRFPIGVARVAEPDPGLHLDVPVLVIGAAMILLFTVGSALPAAIISQRRWNERGRRSRLADQVAVWGLSPAAVQGVRFAAFGRGPRPVPVRSTLVSVTVAIAAAVATLAFAGNLVALVETPSRYGQEWDRMVDGEFAIAPVGRIVDRLSGMAGVAIGVGNYGNVAVNGLAVPAFDLKSVRGVVSMGVTEGQPAVYPDEIVLGGETMDRLGVRVGDTVSVTMGDGAARPMRLSGQGVFPQMGQGSFSTTGLGVGAQLSGGSLQPLGDIDRVPPHYQLDGKTYNFVALDLAGSPGGLDDELSELQAASVADGAFTVIRTEQPPTRIRDLQRIRIIPAVMAAVLALVAVASLAHLLVIGVRDRRRELALLRTLGFTGRQLHATVSWQASVIALTALLIGAPLGLALGHAVWRRFADSLHVAAQAATPWSWLLVVAVVTLVVANVVAALPGQSAARATPAVTLRNE
jgi:hypothetical protein